MPNWCENRVRARHISKENIDKIQAIATMDDPRLFQLLRPRPVYEDDNWFDWNNRYWGTKWDLTDPVQHCERIDDHTIELHFDTAWSPPIPLYKDMISQGYEINAVYWEPDMAFVGECNPNSEDIYFYADLDIDSIKEHVPNHLIEEFKIIESILENIRFAEEEGTVTDDEVRATI